MNGGQDQKKGPNAGTPAPRVPQGPSSLLQRFSEELVGAMIVLKYRQHNFLHLCAEKKAEHTFQKETGATSCFLPCLGLPSPTCPRSTPEPRLGLPQRSQRFPLRGG